VLAVKVELPTGMLVNETAVFFYEGKSFSRAISISSVKAFMVN